MTSFREAAIKILKDVKKPVHYKEITRIALEKNLIKTSGKTPEATMRVIIVQDIKSKKDRSPFRRMKRGFILFNSKYSEPKPKQKERQESIETVSSQYIGSAGEHRVVSELLFCGFNASTMTVDEGLDVVATKDNKLFNIQVKTANKNKLGKYVYDLRRTSFERFDSGNTFYIFVLRDRDTNFLILRSSETDRNIQERNILTVSDGKRYRVNLFMQDGRLYLGNLKNDVTFFLNNWGLIN